MQFFDLSKRQKMSYHTDSRPDKRKPDQICGQEKGSPVITVNLHTDFYFWTVPIVDGDVINPKMKLDYGDERAVILQDGVCMLWPECDDHKFKHAVKPPPDMH